MTTKTRKAPVAKGKPRVITEKQAAAMNFEPWPGKPNLEALPNNDQFTEDGIPHLIACRLALVSMHMTKARLMEMFDEDGDTLLDVLETFQSALDFFSRFTELLDAAMWRYIAAGSKVLQEKKLERKSAREAAIAAEGVKGGTAPGAEGGSV